MNPEIKNVANPIKIFRMLMKNKRINKIRPANKPSPTLVKYLKKYPKKGNEIDLQINAKVFYHTLISLEVLYL